MTNILADITSAQLRRAITIKERIERLETDLNQILGSGDAVANGMQRGRKPMSAAGKAKIAAGQRKRWARVRGATEVPNAAPKKRRKMSAAGRARIAAAARARWKKAKALGKNAL